MSRTFRIALLALGMILVILAMVATYARDLNGGSEITLETEPVDPRSLFLGHYATLGYAINRLEGDLIGEHCYAANDAIFVTLEPDAGGEWRATRASAQMPADGFAEARVTLRGRVLWGSACPAETTEAGKAAAETASPEATEPAAEATAPGETSDLAVEAEPAEEPPLEADLGIRQTWVNYGIEQYFASPEAARKLEDLARRRPAGEDGEPPPAPLEIILSVPRSGRALIKGVVIDGVKTYDQTLW